jgi:hypothetical protein
MEGEMRTHPAYGMVSFSRVSGDPGKLFGSEIRHNSFIRLTVKAGEHKRHLSSDWYFEHGIPLIELDLSAAQFAELVSSMNCGSGVPCTVRWVNGEEHPPIADDKSSFHDTIQSELQKEAKDAFADAQKLVSTLRDTLAKSKLPKSQQADILDLARRIECAVKDSMPFILEQYQEGAEKIGAKAKAELDAFATLLIQKLGTEALAKLNETPAITDTKTDPSRTQ